MALGQLLKFPPAREYIFEADFDTATAEIVAKHSLPIERSEELLHLVNAALDDAVTPIQMPTLIEQAFGVDGNKAKSIAIDLVGKLLLPLAAYKTHLEQEFVQLGGNLADFPTFRVLKENKDRLIIINEVTAAIGIQLTDVLAKRLLFLLEQLATNVKTPEAIKTFFVRSQNIGGLGLNEAQATTLLTTVLPQISDFVPVKEPAIAPVVESVPDVAETVQTDVQAAVEMPKQEVTANLPEIAPSHEVAAEVPVINSPTIVAREVDLSRADAREEVSDEATEVEEVVLARTDVNDKAIKAVKAQVKPMDEVINPDELRGSAKKAVMVRKLTAGVQDSFAAAVALATEKAAPVLKKKKISEKVFADIAGKTIRGLRDVYQTRDQVEREWELKGEDLAVFMDAIAAGVAEYNARPIQAQADRPTPKSNADGLAASLDERFDSLTASDTANTTPPKARAQLTVGSVSVQTSDGQRKVVDIVSAARLAGPIEQLGKMQPSEFRRLSSDPSEAAQKLEDLLSALESTSYEERVKGVLAWRESPMNQLYLQITEEALSQGLALPEISSRRRAAGKDSLSPAEIKALALLNAKIRF